MKDVYRNYDELSRSEILGVDYSIQTIWRTDQLLIMAIHGGGIETGTSEIATAIANPDWSLYIFSGDKRSGNRRLHITSTRFDEPIALKMARRSQHIVSIHGFTDERPIIYLGGRNLLLKNKVEQSIQSAHFHVVKAPPHLSGKNPRNIMNQGLEGGLQLELSSGLRTSFFYGSHRAARMQTTPHFVRFVSAVKEGLKQGLKQL